jgi:hypothetical protein
LAEFAALASCPRAGAATTGRRSVESYRGHAAARTGAATLMMWFKRFTDPIVLEDGRKLLTLRDAADYITTLPQAERDAAHWLIAAEALTLVAERNGAELLARMAMQMALTDDKQPPAPGPGHTARFRIIH